MKKAPGTKPTRKSTAAGKSSTSSKAKPTAKVKATRAPSVSKVPKGKAERVEKEKVIELPPQIADDSKVKTIKDAKFKDGWRLSQSSKRGDGGPDLFTSPDKIEYRKAAPHESADLIITYEDKPYKASAMRLIRTDRAGKHRPRVATNGSRKNGGTPGVTSAGRSKLTDEGIEKEIEALLKKDKTLSAGAGLKQLHAKGIGCNPRRFARIMASAKRSTK